MSELTPPAVNNVEATYDLVKTMRASVLVLGPLLARHGRARVSLPGGCAIGARPIDQHLKGLKALGADIRLEHGYVEATAKQLKGARINFDMPTVGGTEHLMMTAALAKGETVLENAAREPEIIDLANMLNQMGARIEGAGTDTIRIAGVERALHRSATGSCRTGSRPALSWWRRPSPAAISGSATCSWSILMRWSSSCRMPASRSSTRTVLSGSKGPKKVKSVNIKTRPYPGFPTDMQAQFMALMCDCRRGQRHC